MSIPKNIVVPVFVSMCAFPSNSQQEEELRWTVCLEGEEHVMIKGLGMEKP